MNSDFRAVGEFNRHQPLNVLFDEKRFGYLGKSTIYSQEFLLVAADEAHSARNLGWGYASLLRARTKAKSMLALTATPANTRPLVSFVLCPNELMF